jgi:hypothetical protein
VNEHERRANSRHDDRDEKASAAAANEMMPPTVDGERGLLDDGKWKYGPLLTSHNIYSKMTAGTRRLPYICLVKFGMTIF